jgi:hypothetical protein
MNGHAHILYIITERGRQLVTQARLKMREAWYEKWVVQTNLFINDLFVVVVCFFVQIFKRTLEHRKCYGSEVNSFFVINGVNYGKINLMRNTEVV